MKNSRLNRIHRYKEISEILTKYGFTILAEKLHKKGIIKRIVLKKSSALMEKYSRAERLRMALEELGPTFIKLGQLMSTRYDLLPEDIVDELSKLQNNVGAFPWEEAEEILTKELNMGIEDIFLEFDKEPMAAASIGQAYRGKLKTGEKVVMKIRRPNIEDMVNKDLDILKTLSGLLDDYLVKKNVVRFRGVLNDFSTNMKRELNYRIEAQNYDNFRETYKKNNKVIIPKVFWEYTTKKVILTSEVEGIKVSDIEELDNRGYNKEEIALNIADIYMEQIFIHGFYHGDPHPGNLFVVNEDQIGFVDFGIIGYIDDETMKLLILLLKSSLHKNIDKIVEVFYKMDAIPKSTNIMFFKRDINYVINYYYSVPLERLKFGDALNDILRIAFKHKIKVPGQFMLLIKSIINLEGTGRKLNPKFNFVDVSKSVLSKMKKDRLNPDRLVKDTYSLIYDGISDIGEMPGLLNRILYKINRDKINITMEHEGIDDLNKQLDTVSNKLSLSLIISAIIIGSSTIIQSRTGPEIFGMSAIGLIGFLIAGIMGLILVISIILHSVGNKK